MQNNNFPPAKIFLNKTSLNSSLNVPEMFLFSFPNNIELNTECHPVTQLLRRSDTFFGECCGFCVIERLSCQMAGTNGPKKIES